MDLCGLMRLQTINEKKYILVVVDDYSRFTRVKFLRSKDETPEVVIKFLQQIQVGLNNTTVLRTPQQNGIIERRNRTLVEAARTLISVGLVPNPVPAAPYVPPTNKDLEILFQPMFDEYLEPHRVERPVSPAPAVQVPVNSSGTPLSTTIDQDAPSPSISPSFLALQSPSLHQGVAAESTLMKDNPIAPVDN
nr:hypothetical protein [Tanacetum cinerariifolium]